MGHPLRWAVAVFRKSHLAIRASLRLLRLVLWYEAVRRWWLGYGERPLQVVAVPVAIVGITTVLYWQLGTFLINTDTTPPLTGNPTWQSALYFSLASISALGYGNWVPEPLGWALWAGSVEPFFGIISAVALSVTRTQRMNR